MNLKYKGLNWQVGIVNLPGIREDVYAIAKREIVGWPTLKEDFNNSMAELVTYEGNFILAAGAYWQKIGVIVDKSPVEGKSQGTRPSKTFLNQIVLQHPGVEEEASGYCKQANNDDHVYLAQTKKGKWRVVGNEMYQTNTDIEQKLGGAPTDEMGTTLTVTVTDVAPGLFYTGEIKTEDGIINIAQNKVEEVTFTPDGGTVEAGTDTITLATTTVGAAVFYALDGGTWIPYAAPIPTTGWAIGNHTLIAKATKDGMSESIETMAILHV